MSALVDWDSATWGQVGSNVHESAWAPDGRHDDGVSDQ